MSHMERCFRMAQGQASTPILTSPRENCACHCVEKADFWVSAHPVENTTTEH